ncbi:MAG: glycoside hydrolase family 3 C-terminal domain-containing protein [Ignavibacteriales bacterium]|nr:MAG: glycoside hydrolase family 3 C-terminal domain-containing protein [Ignavibacteriales bacterium]
MKIFFRKLSYKLFSRLFLISVLILFPPDIISSIVIFNSDEDASSETVSLKKYPTVFDLTEDEKDWIEETLSKMSIRERCAQMIMPMVNSSAIVEGSSDNLKLKSLVADCKVGGLIIFQGDLESRINIINYFNNLSDLPLLFSADFERGLGTRIIDATEFPYNMALGATGDYEFAFKMGKVIAEESRALGIGLNFAPVADINDNYANPVINLRAYSEDKWMVSQFCSSFIRGSIEGRIISTAKHFPGHGNTRIDSHHDLPIINVDRNSLLQNEFVPFIESIKAGVQAIMIGHLNVPAVEPDNIPSSLSPKIIDDLLRGELSFDGLVITDALNMNAITNYYTDEEAAILAVKAGADILLMPPDEFTAIDAVYRAVMSGEIKLERINESVRRILASKKWLGINKYQTKELSAVKNELTKPEHINLADSIAQRSITLVKDVDSLLPLQANKYKKAVCVTITDGIGSSSIMNFQNGLDKHLNGVKKIFINKKTKKAALRKALDTIKKSDLVIISSFIKVKSGSDAPVVSKTNTDLIKNILKLKKPVVFISFDSPYMLSFFDNAETYICSFGNTPSSQRAMTNALFGLSDVSGRLPITLPYTDFKIGHGVNLFKL